MNIHERELQLETDLDLANSMISDLEADMENLKIELHDINSELSEFEDFENLPKFQSLADKTKFQDLMNIWDLLPDNMPTINPLTTKIELISHYKN